MVLYSSDRNPDRPPLDALLKLADSGAFELPKPIVEARQIEARVRRWAVAHSEIARANVAALTEELADDLVKRATTEEDPPADLGAKIAKAVEQERRLTVASDTIRIAFSKAEAGLFGSVRANDDAVHQAFVKSFGSVLDEARRIAPKVSGYSLREADRGLFVDAPDDARKAFLQLKAAAEQLQNILAARWQLRRLTSGSPKVDTDDQFALHRNAHEVRMPKLNEVELLHWLVTGPADPWLPTSPQQDTHILAAREAMKAAARGGTPVAAA